MTLTDSLVAIVDYQIDLLKSNAGLLGLNEVYYGDQNLIATVPAVCVEGQRKTRDMSGTSFRSENLLRTTLLVYYSQMQDVNATQRDVEILAEQIEEVLHTDQTMGGLVVHGRVIELEPGYAVRERVYLRACRMTWQGISLTHLGG